MDSLLNTRAFALAGAAAGAVITALCFSIFAVLGRPDPWMDLLIGSGPTLGGWLIGIAEIAAFSALTGWLVAALYNRWAATPARGGVAS